MPRRAKRYRRREARLALSPQSDLVLTGGFAGRGFEPQTDNVLTYLREVYRAHEEDYLPRPGDSEASWGFWAFHEGIPDELRPDLSKPGLRLAGTVDREAEAAEQADLDRRRADWLDTHWAPVTLFSS